MSTSFATTGLTGHNRSEPSESDGEDTGDGSDGEESGSDCEGGNTSINNFGGIVVGRKLGPEHMKLIPDFVVMMSISDIMSDKLLMVIEIKHNHQNLRMVVYQMTQYISQIENWVADFHGFLVLGERTKVYKLDRESFMLDKVGNVSTVGMELQNMLFGIMNKDWN